MITAEIVADSVSPEGKRLTTAKCVYPWFIHGEVMTHRVFSRNASSNRAIPVPKMIAEVRDDQLRAEPSFGVINAPGMQGGRPTTEAERATLRDHWRAAALAAADSAHAMAALGGAKQDVNRLLMPFTHARVLITATEWDNFFGLRLHKDAQPEARLLANAIWDAMKNSKPKQIKVGGWHFPFISDDDEEAIMNLIETDWNIFPSDEEWCKTCIKVSVARCARVSYETHEDGKRSTLVKDLALYDQLTGSGHWSPLEHQATPMMARRPWLLDVEYDRQAVEQGNLRGWRQYRKMLAGEACAPLPQEYVR